MTRTRKFYAFVTPAAVAGLVFLIGLPSYADDDDDGDYIDIDTGDDDRGTGAGYVNVASNPWADVYIDGVHVGTTPLAQYELTPGRHRITFVNKDHGIKETQIIVVRPGENVNIARSFGGHDVDPAMADAAHAKAHAAQAKAAAKQAKAAVKQAKAQLKAAKQRIANNPHISDDMRGMIEDRVDKALEAVENNLANLNFNGDWDAFESQMEALGEQMNDAFDGMDDDFDQLGKDISKQVRKALKHQLKHGIHIDIDGDGDDDDITMVVPPTPPTPPTPPVYMGPGPNTGISVIDMSDMNMGIDIDALGLSSSQKNALRDVMEAEQRVVQPMEEQLEQLSDKLREALDNVDVDDQTIDRYVDQIADREAEIRKARLKAWAKARKVLDEDQRQHVQRHHGP